MKKMFVITVGLLVVFLLFLWKGGAASQKLRFGTVVISPQYHLPFIAAQEKGLWKEQGLEVEWVSFRGGPLAYRGLAAEELDMVMGGTTGAVQSLIAGVPQTLVADVRTSQGFHFWVLVDSPVKEGKDLKGARIGVTGLGSLTHAYGRMVTRSLGLEKDVTFVAVGGVKEQAAALKARAIDAVVFDSISTAPLKVAGETRELLRLDDFFPKEWVEVSILARSKFAAANRELVVRAIKGFFRATDFIENNRSWALEKMKSSMGYTEKEAEVIYPLLKYGKHGKINIKGLQNQLNFLVQYGIVAKEKVPPLEKIYDKSFAEEAAQ